MMQKSSPGFSRAGIGTGDGVKASIDPRLNLIDLRAA
jgi:hypothetical protein